MAVLYHIVYHSIPLKTSEVWRAASFNTLTDSASQSYLYSQAIADDVNVCYNRHIMSDLNLAPKPEQPSLIAPIVVIVLMLIALAMLLVLKSNPEALGASFSPPAPPPSPTLTPAPSNTPTTAPTTLPTLTATSTVWASATATRTSTATPTITATPTPTPPPDHYWLRRPLGPDAVDRSAARFYPYGSRGDGTYFLHHGVDMVNPMGTQVLAAADGTVVVVGDDLNEVYGARTDFYGNLIVVRLDRQYQGELLFTLYGHLSKMLVETGQRVQAGDVLGEVGMTGVAMGPHLHFEIRVGENLYASTRNPELWIEPLEGRGTIAGRLVDASGDFVPETLITVHLGSAPDEPWQETTTYPRDQVNPDDDWKENFVLGDVPPGNYVLRTQVGEHYYAVDVEVEEGKTTLVIIQTAD